MITNIKIKKERDSRCRIFYFSCFFFYIYKKIVVSI